MKIMKFESFSDAELLKRLNVKNIDPSMYFFDNKAINKFYRDGFFGINVIDISVGTFSLMIHLDVSYKNVKYDIGVYYDDFERLNYDDLDLLKNAGADMGKFNEIVNEIITDLLPSDFWEVRSKNN